MINLETDLFEDSRASKAIKKYNKQYEKNIKNTDDEDFLNFSGDGSADYDSFVVIPEVVKPTQNINPKIIQYGGAFQNSKDAANLPHFSCILLLLIFFA